MAYGFAGGLASGLEGGMTFGLNVQRQKKQQEQDQQSVLFKQSQQALKVAKSIADNATSYVNNIPDRNSLNMDVQNHSIAQLQELSQMFAARGDQQTADAVMSYANPIKSAKTQGEISQAKSLAKANEKFQEANAAYEATYGSPATTADLAAPASGVPGINSPAGASADGSTTVTTNPNGPYSFAQPQTAQADQASKPDRKKFIIDYMTGNKGQPKPSADVADFMTTHGGKTPTPDELMQFKGDEAQAKKYPKLPLPQAKKSLGYVNDTMDNVIDTADSILNDKALSGSVGINAQVLPSIAGTPHYNFWSKVEKLKSQLGKQAIDDLKSASAQGNLGFRMTQVEFTVLTNAIANLDPQQGEDQFKENVRHVVALAKGLKSRAQDAFDETYGGKQSDSGKSNAAPKSPSEMTDDELLQQLGGSQ